MGLLSMSVTLTAMRTLIHLVRHAEVHNPDNIFYGRLEGFQLSERGLRQAEALGKHFAERPLDAIYSSPLTRAQQTATAIATPHDIEITVDEDLLESESRLEGKYGDKRLFKNPFNARLFINPLRPSWGESYDSIRSRMLAAVERMREKYAGGEVVAVSHMTPILVARLGIESNPKQPWRAGISCSRASVTSFEFDGDRYVSTRYEPVGSAIN